MLFCTVVTLAQGEIPSHFTNQALHTAQRAELPLTLPVPRVPQWLWKQQGATNCLLCSKIAKFIEGLLLILYFAHPGFGLLSWLKQVKLQIPTWFFFFAACFNIKNRISHCTLSWGSILPSLLEWRRKAKKTRSSCSRLPVRLDFLEILGVHYQKCTGSTS